MIFLHFQRTFPTRVTEWLLGAVLFSWGWMLLRPEETFAGPGYVGLARLASEEVWGWSCLLIGSARLVVLAVNGMWIPSYRVRSLAAFLSCFFWLQISLGFAASGLPSTALCVYPWFLLADIYCVYRAARDYQMASAHRG